MATLVSLNELSAHATAHFSGQTCFLGTVYHPSPSTAACNVLMAVLSLEKPFKRRQPGIQRGRAIPHAAQEGAAAL